MPDGDNKKSTIVYNDEHMNVVAYTRNIEDKYGCSDIISLVGFINKEENFSKNMKWICDILGIDYYGNNIEELPESIQWTKWMLKTNSGEQEEENEPLQPISEKILEYYKPYLSKLLYDDGIPYEIQKDFEIGYDLATHRITFPIRDELGTLVGVKGRSTIKTDTDKYIYIEPCAKSHIVYGLWHNYNDIKKQDSVIVVESEKSVMKLMAHGYFNVVAIAGHQLSKTQVEKLTRLSVSEIILCYDEEVGRDKSGKVRKSEYMKEVSKFIPQQNVSLMVDINKEILYNKESPADDIDKFKMLYENRIRLQRK